jgi:hypothetical protein
MKTLAALYLLFVCLTARDDLPTESPQSALFITSCHQIVIIMADGKTLFFDSHSKESADDVKALASRSKIPARVYEVGCYMVEGVKT